MSKLVLYTLGISVAFCAVNAHAQAKDPLATFTFGYTYPRSDPKHTARPSSCAAITAEQRKTITACKADGTLKRCRLDAKTSINIFTSEPDCKASLHDVTEGD